jgi:hypothetical protein
MRRRLLLVAAATLLPGMALAQGQATQTPPWRGSGPPRSAAERDERHRWLEQNWDLLTPEQRRDTEERFRRGMGPDGPDAEEMRQRWRSMTPSQRQELMYGPHRMGQGGGPRRGPPGGPPPAPPRQGG